MNTLAHSGWFVHGAALLLAAGGGWCAVSYGGLLDVWCSALPRKADFEYPLSGYFDNYTQHPRLAAALQRTFEEGTSIVLFGSSELTTADHPSKPAIFFNERLNVRAFYERVINTPVISTSFPSANTNMGISLRFTLAQ